MNSEATRLLSPSAAPKVQSHVAGAAANGSACPNNVDVNAARYCAQQRYGAEVSSPVGGVSPLAHQRWSTPLSCERMGGVHAGGHPWW